MKKLMFVFLTLLLAITVAAGTKEGKKTENADNAVSAVLTGKVIDSGSGELLVGVEVKIEETGQKTYSDLDGNFSFTAMKPGEYKLTTNYISYKACSENLEVNGKENQVTIKLENSN